MSHYVDIETNICDGEALVRALERVGFKGQVEVHEIAQALYGYQGDRRQQKANIILRREHVGSASNDIGFELMESGRYRSHISEFDQSKYGQEWQDKLNTYYGVEKAKKEYEVRNIKYEEDVDEKERPRLRAFL